MHRLLRVRALRQRGQQRLVGGGGGGGGRLVGAGRRRHPVADDRHDGGRAVGQRGRGQREGVLVAVVAQPAVADRARPRRAPAPCGRARAAGRARSSRSSRRSSTRPARQATHTLAPGAGGRATWVSRGRRASAARGSGAGERVPLELLRRPSRAPRTACCAVGSDRRSSPRARQIRRQSAVRVAGCRAVRRRRHGRRDAIRCARTIVGWSCGGSGTADRSYPQAPQNRSPGLQRLLAAGAGGER